MSTTDSTTAVEFREIPGYPGFRVSACGRVQSRWERNSKRPVDWRELTPKFTGPVSTARWRVSIRTAEKSVSVFLHVLVLTAFVGPRPPGMQGCHNDGNCHNNHLSNLRWDTPKGNSADRYKHGTDTCGMKHFGVRLTDDDVREIRRRLAAGETPSALGREYGMTSGYIRAIKHRRKWRHI